MTAPELRADCSSCFGLCCVALTFQASADFPFDKPAGEPCRNLKQDFGCGIHRTLLQEGFGGCTAYDCFGAGQKVSQVTFTGTDWRQAPETAASMFEALPIMRQLHELLWYLTEALTLMAAQALHEQVRTKLDETRRLTDSGPADLVRMDVAAHRHGVDVLLLETSRLVRAEAPQRRKQPGKQARRGADLIGARLRGADLRGADLRGAYLITADLRDADLRLADLIGADLRDADLRGAELTSSIFLTQTQVNAARGDGATKLPPALIRPSVW